MNLQEFEEKLQHAERPVIVEFWAPWCTPCKMMAPALEHASRQYEGRVDLWKINADENQDLIRSLGILGIPTILGYRSGKQIFRRTGSQNGSALLALFESAESDQPIKPGPTPMDRLLRLGGGLALVLLAFLSARFSILLFILGGALMFTAVYDRCPIYRAIAPRVKAIFNGNKSAV
jgi:thioredoxin 1